MTDVKVRGQARVIWATLIQSRRPSKQSRKDTGETVTRTQPAGEVFQDGEGDLEEQRGAPATAGLRPMTARPCIQPTT